MRYRLLTVAREYGSGGAAIASIVAARLGWKLLDNALIEEAARIAKVDPQCARGFDERVDSWLHRLSRRGLWHGGLAAVPAVSEDDIFDAETMTRLACAMIERACEVGNGVVVGRGSQCVLQDRPDVFHVFVYAPWTDRVKRLRRRLVDETDAQIAAVIETRDAERARYVHLNYGCDWRDPHLYDLLVSSKLGDEATASVILCAMGR
jgi:cytidylate kinase